ncbi:hypothetical protein HIM_09424 [Hirsutella minnesotensis 3608]|uniref:Carboxylic ester hydrolase n=1 Tax=Hirsutella minnesotensis 3608 TaxID=1043627 RepID=A0A0F8A341_9HYPO|nr:hypothetical protein HIM_09424 [Hirsutella minnesotensis 3608]
MAPRIVAALILFLQATLVYSDGDYSQVAESPTVTLSAGPVMGRRVGSVNQFLGLPFAEPPGRFEPPKPATAWQGTYNATKHKPSCIQKFKYPKEAHDRTMRWYNNPPPPSGESENCLYLNVFTPRRAKPGSKPVMFWLFGGGFSFGTGSLPLYDGTSFAENQDIVIVTVNYRTNIFGFPGSPEIPKEEQNLGLLDQRLALDWVQRNIHAFGGDPDRVTLFGQSAGAGSIDLLVTNPPEPIPFIAAIMQSGQGSITLPNRISAKSWHKLVSIAKCDPMRALACIRDMPVEKVLEYIERRGLAFFPIFDGATWTGTGRVDRRKSTVAEPRIARVPVLVGSTADDGGVFVYGQKDLRAFLLDLLPKGFSLIDRIKERYGNKNDVNKRAPVNHFLASVVKDFNFGCPAKIIAEESASVGIPSWRYYFDAGFANTEIFPGSGAYHCSEISLIFGTFPRNGTNPYQKQLSKTMQKAWADFAKNPTKGPGWEPTPKVSVFGDGYRPNSRGDGKRRVMVVRKPGLIDFPCSLYDNAYNAGILLSR